MHVFLGADLSVLKNLVDVIDNLVGVFIDSLNEATVAFGEIFGVFEHVFEHPADADKGAADFVRGGGKEFAFLFDLLEAFLGVAEVEENNNDEECSQDERRGSENGDFESISRESNIDTEEGDNFAVMVFDGRIG